MFVKANCEKILSPKSVMRNFLYPIWHVSKVKFVHFSALNSHPWALVPRLDCFRTQTRSRGTPWTRVCRSCRGTRRRSMSGGTSRSRPWPCPWWRQEDTWEDATRPASPAARAQLLWVFTERITSVASNGKYGLLYLIRLETVGPMLWGSLIRPRDSRFVWKSLS